MKDEKDIIGELKKGNENSFRFLYEHHYKSLCLFANEFVKDEFIAETIVSDVIFSLWQNREKLEIKQSLRNYLIKSVKNGCINYLLHIERQGMLRQHVGDIIDENQKNYERDASSPLALLIEKELDSKIDKCINSLPELTKKIFCMSRFENLKYDEIALKANVSVDVVKYHIKSALLHLRTDLKDFV